MAVWGGVLVAISVLAALLVGFVAGFITACFGWIDKLKTEDYVDGRWERRRYQDE